MFLNTEKIQTGIFANPIFSACTPDDKNNTDVSILRSDSQTANDHADVIFLESGLADDCHAMSWIKSNPWVMGVVGLPIGVTNSLLNRESGLVLYKFSSPTMSRLFLFFLTVYQNGANHLSYDDVQFISCCDASAATFTTFQYLHNAI